MSSTCPKKSGFIKQIKASTFSMNTKKILIFGTSQYAEIAAHYISIDTEYEVSGYVVDDEYYTSDNFAGKSVSKLSDTLASMPPNEAYFFCAIGYKSIRQRRDIYQKLHMLGYSFVSVKSKHAYCDPTATIGENSIIMPNCVIEKNAVIGDNVVVWSNSTVCHDAKINDHCFIASNSTIGGNAIIQEMSFLGFSSTVLQNTNCASETLLGAMSLLTQDSKKSTKYVGVPATASGRHLKDGICIP